MENSMPIGGWRTRTIALFHGHFREFLWGSILLHLLLIIGLKYIKVPQSHVPPKKFLVVFKLAPPPKMVMKPPARKIRMVMARPPVKPQHQQPIQKIAMLPRPAKPPVTPPIKQSRQPVKPPEKQPVHQTVKPPVQKIAILPRHPEPPVVPLKPVTPPKPAIPPKPVTPPKPKVVIPPKPKLTVHPKPKPIIPVPIQPREVKPVLDHTVVPVRPVRETPRERLAKTHAPSMSLHPLTNASTRPDDTRIVKRALTPLDAATAISRMSVRSTSQPTDPSTFASPDATLHDTPDQRNAAGPSQSDLSGGFQSTDRSATGHGKKGMAAPGGFAGRPSPVAGPNGNPGKGSSGGGAPGGGLGGLIAANPGSGPTGDPTFAGVNASEMGGPGSPGAGHGGAAGPSAAIGAAGAPGAGGYQGEGFSGHGGRAGKSLPGGGTVLTSPGGEWTTHSGTTGGRAGTGGGSGGGTGGSTGSTGGGSALAGLSGGNTAGGTGGGSAGGTGGGTGGYNGGDTAGLNGGGTGGYTGGYNAGLDAGGTGGLNGGPGAGGSGGGNNGGANAGSGYGSTAGPGGALGDGSLAGYSAGGTAGGTAGGPGGGGPGGRGHRPGGGGIVGGTTGGAGLRPGPNTPGDVLDYGVHGIGCVLVRQDPPFNAGKWHAQSMTSLLNWMGRLGLDVRIPSSETDSYVNLVDGDYHNVREFSYDDIKSFPMIFMTGDLFFALTPGEKDALRKYVFEDGGTIYGEDCHMPDHSGRVGGFDAPFHRYMEDIFRKPMRNLPMSHLIYHIKSEIRTIPKGDQPKDVELNDFEGLLVKDDQGQVREGVIYTRNDYGDVWNPHLSYYPAERRDPAYAMGANLYLYAMVNYGNFHRSAGR